MKGFWYRVAGITALITLGWVYMITAAFILGFTFLALIPVGVIYLAYYILVFTRETRVFSRKTVSTAVVSAEPIVSLLFLQLLMVILAVTPPLVHAFALSNALILGTLVLYLLCFRRVALGWSPQRDSAVTKPTETNATASGNAKTSHRG